jgi:hypothetical protein
MNLVNNTDSQVVWFLTNSAGTDCGTIEPQGSSYFPAQPGDTYTVSFGALKPQNFQTTAQANQTVTLGLTVTNPTAVEDESVEPEAAVAP